MSARFGIPMLVVIKMGVNNSDSINNMAMPEKRNIGIIGEKQS